MSNYAVINLKTKPSLKLQAQSLADDLGISLSAVLNNELIRFVQEKSVSFEIIEAPNTATAKSIKKSLIEVNTGDYHRFANSADALKFLEDQLV